ncbi:MAG TPA: hypothetical protein H9870_11315 [Candidatus Corynebacterium avicola]|uniref:Uncharacterized protein n=1 Tax=Candidatus Corynebacterium avicola TaxID=2838527 RepID=A0A9D1UMV4_9CORY|nr:hypothetical protein [Candidatus Corynebacterium avicola]
MNPFQDDVSSFVNPAAVNPAMRLRMYRPTTVKKVAAWCGVVFGVLMLASGFAGTSDSLVADLLLGFGFGAGCIIPGAYWLLCNRRDSKLVTDWMLANRDYKANWEMLAADERDLFSRPEELPEIPERHWKTVWLLMVGAFAIAMVGAAFLPDPETTGAA